MIAHTCRGAGLGLRIPHIQQVLNEKPPVPWFEVHICNFLTAPLNRHLLRQVAEHYPLSFHGVSLNLGGIDELDWDYLTLLKKAINDFQPALVSEHAAFTALNGQYFHDLLPVPYTREAVQHFSERINRVQDFLGHQILIENVSRYFNYDESELTEAQFLSEISQLSDCGLVVDLNNIYVNQRNFPDDGDSIESFLNTIPFDRIGEVHLAGFSEHLGQLIDTHGSPVSDVVWQSFASFLQDFQQHLDKPNATDTNTSNIRPYPKATTLEDLPCLIEWDNNLPDFSRLNQERITAQAMIDRFASHQQQVPNVAPPWQESESENNTPAMRARA